MSWSRPATPNARTCLGAAAEVLGQPHRQHRDVERVRRRVLVELLQLQQRQHHAAVAVHRHRQRPHDGFGLEQRHRALPSGPRCCSQRKVSASSPSVTSSVASSGGARRLSVCPCSPTAPKRMPSERIWRFSLVSIADSVEPREDLVQEAVELVAADLTLELQPLDAGGDQPAAPVPGLELAQRLACRRPPRPRGT